MKKHEDLQINVHDTIKLGSSLDATGNGFTTRMGKNLKKGMYITGLVGVALFFNACMGGYVATEPTYVEGVRPPAPSNVHVWINGDWAWNRQTHVYVQRDGYWSRPNPGRTYISGHWETNPRGHSYTRGHWQRQGRQENPNRR